MVYGVDGAIMSQEVNGVDGAIMSQEVRHDTSFTGSGTIHSSDT